MSGVSTGLSPVVEAALAALGEMVERRALYDALNARARALQGDSQTLVQHMDGETEDKVVNLLDLVLGDDLASYLLYESRGRPSSMTIDGETWPIGCVGDVRAWLLWRARAARAAGSAAP